MTTTDVQGRIVAGGGLHHLWLNGATDGTETEIKVRGLGGELSSIGEALLGQVLQNIAIQASDGSILTTLKLYDNAGGVLLSIRGNERTVRNLLTNASVGNLNIKITSGMLLKVNTAD